MKHGFVISLSLVAFGLTTTAAERANPNRVPPPGLSIAETNRAELRAGADQLAKEIAVLREGLKSKPSLLELMPDVVIFHKAVDWALRYDGFYRSNEVGLVRGC